MNLSWFSIVIDKLVTTGSKSKNNIVTEAFDLAKSEVDDWSSQFEVVGKTYNPDTKEVE